MAIRRINVDIVKLANGIIPGTKEGDHLLSFPGGVQFIVPQDVIDNLDPANDPLNVPVPAARTTALPTIKIIDVEGSASEDIESGDVAAIDPEKDITTKVCNECGASVKHVMPSGKCYACARVKCPTCKAEASRAEMIGQYCPKCLPRNRG